MFICLLICLFICLLTPMKCLFSYFSILCVLRQYIPLDNERRTVIQKYLHTYVYCSAIYNKQEIKSSSVH